MKKINLLIFSIIMILMVACSSADSNNAVQATATPNANNEEGALQPASDDILDQLESVEEGASEALDSILELDDSLSAEAVSMVVQSVARVIEHEDTSLTPNDVTIISVEPTQWSDGSLGCPIEGMMYTQAIVPGYQIEIEANGNIYEVHTDTASRTALCIVNGEKITPE